MRLTLALDEDLVDVGHHAAGVTELVLVVNVVLVQLGVAGVVLDGAEVSGGEQLALTATHTGETREITVRRWWSKTLVQ
jgi:hypothetical protein